MEQQDTALKNSRYRSPYRLASRRMHPDDTVVTVKGVHFGGRSFPVIAGPCSIESEGQMMEAADAVKRSGADMLRGGAFKPRTSPYDFQGLGGRGLELLAEAGRRTGLPTVSEILDAADLPLYKDIDMIQVGARNMQNTSLLKALGRQDKPVLLKRGQCARCTELLTAAEYILAEGNQDVVLCERGIRTFETRTRNTLDVSAIPVLHGLTHLPVIADPSHATGRADLVRPAAMAAAAAGADGLIIEVHPDPESALSDGAQSLTPEEFRLTAEAARAVRTMAADYL
jgi:3-deoxy-7-phosphoheptulonate synthase